MRPNPIRRITPKPSATPAPRPKPPRNTPPSEGRPPPYGRPPRPSPGQLYPVVSVLPDIALPYPVFERAGAEPAGPSAATDPASDPGIPQPGALDELVWEEPQPLSGMMHPARPGMLGPGLFVIERWDGDAWMPGHAGMSAVSVGDALRWIVHAPAILGLPADWDALRVRVARAGFDTSGPAGRARLRRLRDQTAQAAQIAHSTPVPAGPGPLAPAPSVRENARVAAGSADDSPAGSRQARRQAGPYANAALPAGKGSSPPVHSAAMKQRRRPGF